MNLTSLVFALCAQQAPAAKAATPAAPNGWQNVDVMRRMLVQRVSENGEEIAGAPKVTVVTQGGDRDDDPNLSPDQPYASNATGAPDSVVQDFLFARNDGTPSRNSGAGIASSAEYVPGLAAVISLTVPVQTVAVETETAKEADKKPAETRSSDDDAWDALAKGETAADGATRQWLGYARALTLNVEAKPAPKEVRFRPESVKALRDTLADTLARFGSRVGLESGERLAIVVRLTSAGRFMSRQGGMFPADGGSEPADAAFRSAANLSTALWSLSRSDASTPPPSQRMVIQVAANDLAAYKQGDLDKDELLRRIRAQSFGAGVDSETHRAR